MKNKLFNELQEFEIEATDNFDMIWKYADGYYESANILLQLLLKEERYDFYPEEMKKSIINIDQQEQIFPILFLYRQYIELAIKGIYMKYIQDKNKIEKIMKHSIKDIWKELITATNNFNNLKDIEFDENDFITINYFISLDNDSFKLRYPFSKDLTSYFDKNKKINLLDLKSKIDFFNIFISELL